MRATESAPRASILIVTASAGQRLRRCLECLAAARPAVEHETIVVVNGAGADVAAEVREFAGAARVEHSEVNIGLAGALNRGRSLAGGEFVVLLHDDAEVGAGWLEGLVAAAERDPGAGAVGSLVVDRDGRVSAAGWQLLPDGTTRPPWDVEPPPAGEFRGVRAVDYCGTCSLLVRASTWDRVGGADETLYPLYYVDVDLCLGIRARGERVLCDPASVVVHLGGASTTHDFALFATARNRVRLLEKWGPLVTTHLAGSGATFRLEPEALPVQGRESDPIARERETAREFAADQRRRLAARASEVSALHEHLASLESAHDGLARELERAQVEVRARDAGLADLQARAAAETARAACAEARAAVVEGELASVASEAVWLRGRAENLARVEAGGWWRLRGRIRPVLLAARALERYVRRLGR
jgi:GT2 family glycosyltransferase